MMTIKVPIVSKFTPFNFAALSDSQNSRNKGHANIKGFTVVSNDLNVYIFVHGAMYGST